MRPTDDRDTEGSSAPKSRRAAAIMFTDMVGYSALAQRDEALSIKLLADQRKVARAAFALHDGEEVKTIGDAFLVVFSNAKNAVRCALDIQSRMAARNANVPPHERILLRIGIHGGEILRSKNDILGDNVNIAARIYPLAEPGGVCISETVHAQINSARSASGRPRSDSSLASGSLIDGLDAEAVPLGTAELKNVARMRVYAVVPSRSDRASRVRMAVRFASRQQRWRRRAAFFGIVAATLIAWPFVSARLALQVAGDRIAIADIENLTGESYLDGISGMLTTSLEQSRRLRVVTRTRILDANGLAATARVDAAAAEAFCRNEKVRVLLTSTIRKSSDTYVLRMTAIDPVDGRTWFEIDESDDADRIPAMIDRLSSRVRLELFEHATDVKSTEVRIADAVTTNLEAYQHYFSGEQYINAWDVGHAEAELKLATEIDPRFAMAWMQLAYTYWWNSDPRAKPALERAVELKERIVTRRERMLLEVLEARVALRDDDAAKVLEALLLDYPSDKSALFELADLRFHRSELETSAKLFETVLSLDPNHQRARDHLVWAYGALGRGPDMLRHAEIYVARTPSPRAWLLLVDSHAWLGQRDEALAALERWRVALPENANIQGAGRVHLVLGDLDAATKAAATDPEIEIRRGVALMRGQVAEVLATIDTKSSGSGYRQAARAVTLAFHGSPKDAAETARGLMRTGQLQDPIGLEVVVACGRAGDTACATDAAGQQTSEAIVLLAKAYASEKAGDRAAALARFAEGRSKIQIRHQPVYWLEEAELLLESGDAAAAELAARKALAMRVYTPLFPLVTPRLHEVLARSLDAQEKRDAATEEWTRLATWLDGADANLALAERVRTRR